MKMSIFQWAGGSIDAEKAVNSLLASGVKVLFVKQTSCSVPIGDYETCPIMGTCLTVWYEELETQSVSDKSGLLQTNIYNFDWGTKRSTRINNVCNNAGIVTLADLIAKTPEGMLKYRNFGEFCLFDVRKKLKELGLSLADDCGGFDSTVKRRMKKRTA